MYLGEQLPKPTDARLMLAAQLGVQHIAVEMGSELYDASETGRWDAGRIRDLQGRAAANGISVDVIGLEMGALLLDIIRGNAARRDAQLAVIVHNIRAAAEAGVPCLKYALHMIGIPTPSRGSSSELSRSRRSAASSSPSTRRTRRCRTTAACAASITSSAAWTA
jgi:D-mannonate dehydratase